MTFVGEPATSYYRHAYLCDVPKRTTKKPEFFNTSTPHIYIYSVSWKKIIYICMYFTKLSRYD